MKSGRPKPLVAVVDDDRDFLEAVRQMLSPAFETACFSTGDGLPGDFGDWGPDLLILDLHMPGTDGAGVCRRVRSDHRFKDLPVLFLTASRADEDFVKTLRVGADAYLTKPIGAAALRRKVREALGRNSASAVS